ncbi:SDR family oxidoreductase [Streptomyces sp. NPDC053048]|uniref:SDR family oxidoreductase n=1 Tax=Streptomyces sp. NPDC053048 TaxID=3365694 RepID=UPI0037D12A13
MRIRDSVVVVTGASSGIGRATAMAFAQQGCAVVLAARSEVALRAAANSCSGRRGTRTLVVATDVSDADAVDRLAQRAVERFGRIDAWINAAAVSVYGAFGDVPMEDFRRVLDVNVMGCVHGARVALRVMRKQGRGTLVNVVSVLGLLTMPYDHPYVMSKHAVRALSSALRQELWLEGEKRIHVCTVLPATVDTPLFEHAANHTGRRPVAMPPVYRAERVARAIVNVVRVPRREVPIGATGLLALVGSRLSPALVERMAARRTRASHFSPDEPAPATHGNLYQPTPGTGAVDGGWGGRHRDAR